MDNNCTSAVDMRHTVGTSAPDAVDGSSTGT